MTVPDLSTREGRERLRKIADIATPGPWESYRSRPADGSSDYYSVEDASDVIIVRTDITPAGSADTDFIAAFDPPTVTALLDALDTAEARTEEVARAGADYANQVTEDLRRAEARADRAEAALQRVRGVLSKADRDERWWVREWGHHAIMTVDIWNALSGDLGSSTTYCGLGPCALGDGHAGPCRM